MSYSFVFQGFTCLFLSDVETDLNTLCSPPYLKRERGMKMFVSPQITRWEIFFRHESSLLDVEWYSQVVLENWRHCSYNQDLIDCGGRRSVQKELILPLKIIKVEFTKMWTVNLIMSWKILYVRSCFEDNLRTAQKIRQKFMPDKALNKAKVWITWVNDFWDKLTMFLRRCFFFHALKTDI